MAYNTAPLVITGDLWTAANQNTYLRDNLTAIWVGTTAGDLEYYSSAIEKTRIPLDTEGKILTSGASVPEYNWMPTGFNYIIGNGVETINTGIQTSPIVFPYDFVITSVQVLAASGETGSIAIDLWVDTYANCPATVADTITAAAKPTITTASKATDSTLTGWTTAIASGSHMIVNVDSVTDFTQVTLAVLGYKKAK